MTEASWALPFNQLPIAKLRWDLWGLRSRLEGTFATIVLFTSVVLINILQMTSFVLLPISRRVVRRFNRACAETWWGWCVSLTQGIHGTRLVLTGDEVPPQENAIVVANHQQMPDIVALFILARPKKRLGDMKWFVKDALKFVPGVGWGMIFLDCIFLKRNWDSDQAHIERTFSKFRREDIPLWLVSFPEGTRLTPAKLEKSRQYALRAGLQPPRHVLVPRTKGFAASVQGLRGHATAIYDVTIAYPDGVPTLWQFVCGQARVIHMDVRRVPVTHLPPDSDGVSQWLVQAFDRKDTLLSRFAVEGRLG